ncbi:hypothetical protein RvY_13988 [Ramazzottius varieornatus]|uniref:Uncharacterized protein n=1 Tax=Ramazzottius varieornatus TaxID=947166 RepID=A0A1D1VPU3_RAMVA|nr:hypothetical protein RvY_13988 [Ramazzottius varieornatus]
MWRSAAVTEEADGETEPLDSQPVSFFVSNSRRASDESSGVSRSLSSETSRHRQSRFFLFHTFQLNCQSGGAVVLPPVCSTGSRILVASRNDSVYCLYFHITSVTTNGVEEIVLAPKVQMVTSLPLHRGWKFGAFVSHILPVHDHEGSSKDYYALAYLSDKPSSVKPPNINPEPQTSSGSSYVVTVITTVSQDEELNRLYYSHIVVPFAPHGCNPLAWWTKPGQQQISLLIPSQKEQMYEARLSLSGEESMDQSGLALESLSESDVGLMLKASCVNALEYVDVEKHSLRIMAVSQGPRSLVACFTFSWLTQEWRRLWSAQHDSMTSKMRLFWTGDQLNLLVIGLLEVAVLYLDIMSSERPVCVALQGSNQYDVVTCADVGVMDNQPMVLLGTYGKAVLIYIKDEHRAFRLQVLETSCPVCFVAFTAMTSSVKAELVVLTQRGLQVYYVT